MDINSSITEITKITKPQIAALKKLEICKVQDLLFHLPFRYLDFSKIKKINALTAGENVSIEATIKNIGNRFSFKGRMSLAEAIVSDETGSLKIVWFNQAYIVKSLEIGEKIFLAGTPEYYKGILQFTNPIYEKASNFPVHTSRLVPVYHLTARLYPKTLRNLIAKVLSLTDKLIDTLPKQVLKNNKLLSIAQTIKYSHFPENPEIVEEAKKRLAFEEIFINQLSAQKYKLELAQKQSYSVPFDQKLTKKFVDALPFKLTKDQKKCGWQILQDLEKKIPMNRLLEGDVGSGKTLVALMAALQVMNKGLQVAFLTPTEILAKQHFETCQKFLKKPSFGFNARCALLTNNFSIVDAKEKPKKQLQKLIEEGMPGLYIGTHALLQKKVKFKNLALVVIDEQHRFGVKQRSCLIKQSKIVPHLLSLTATPIPRTLKLAFYGELSVSQIKQKPSGRKPIITKLVEGINRTKTYDFVSKQIKAGRQTFVITPLIEESDKLGVKSAKKELLNLKKIFPEVKLGLMHGKLKGKEKETVMQDFLLNKIQILVSTSVVEVGVDIPNASVMVIEGAERFGLAQLHQFRGRVGRAEHQSYCFLFTTNNNLETNKRLNKFTNTQDGFELAELDLKQRGFGELYGSQQSGWDFKYFNSKYTALIEPARKEALEILKSDLNLNKYPLLKEKIANKTIHFE